MKLNDFLDALVDDFLLGLMTVHAIRSAWYGEDFVVIETVNK